MRFARGGGCLSQGWQCEGEMRDGRGLQVDAAKCLRAGRAEIRLDGQDVQRVAAISTREKRKR